MKWFFSVIGWLLLSLTIDSFAEFILIMVGGVALYISGLADDDL